MKSTDRISSQNKKNKPDSDILLYALLLVLVALLVGGLAWWFWSSEEKQLNHDYEKALGKFSSSPTEKEVSKLISDNRTRRKSAKRVLNDKIKGRRLSTKEKKEVRDELKNINEELNERLQNTKIKGLEKRDPSLLNIIYRLAYEEGMKTVRLRDKTAVGRSKEELKAQEKVQSKWDISKQEEEEITKKMNGWIKGWYFQAKDELIGNNPGQYPLLTEYIEPLWYKGEKIEEPTRSLIDKYKEPQTFKDKKGIITVVDLSKPLEIEFKGYYGFLTEEDKKDSSEGTETFGLTKYNHLSDMYLKEAEVDGDHEPIPPVPREFFLVRFCDNNCRKMEIGLEKKLFFNRLGYEEWLIRVTDKGNWNCFDICFEEVVETIAHELAHAIVNTTKGRYEGEEGGGHGQFFYEVMEKIEIMIKNSPEFEEFETWWKLPEKEHVRFTSTGKESHWDKWKVWYISGGALIMISAVGLAVVFWPERASSKRNAKN